MEQNKNSIMEVICKKEIFDYDDSSNDSKKTVKLNEENGSRMDGGQLISDSFQSPVECIKKWELQMKVENETLKMEVEKYKKELNAEKEKTKQTECKLREVKEKYKSVKSELEDAYRKTLNLEGEVKQSKNEKQEVDNKYQKLVQAWKIKQKEMDQNKSVLLNKLNDMLKCSFFQSARERSLSIENKQVSNVPQSGVIMENSAVSMAKSNKNMKPVSKHALPNFNSKSLENPPKKVKKSPTPSPNSKVIAKSTAGRKSEKTCNEIVPAKQQRKLDNSQQSTSSMTFAVATVGHPLNLSCFPTGKPIVYPTVQFGDNITFHQSVESKLEQNVGTQETQSKYENSSGTGLNYDMYRNK